MLQKNDHYFDYIIHLMDFLQQNHMEMEQLAQPEIRERLLSGSAELATAYEFVKFMDEMPGGFLIYYADSTERLIYANRALLRIFRCDSMAEFRTLTGNTFRGIVHPEDLDQVEKSIYDQMQGSQYHLDYVEYRIIRKDGMVRWIEDYGHFVQGKDGRDIFYVFLSDATEKRNRFLSEKELLLYESNLEKEKLQNVIQEYDMERALINQEYLRRLEVIQGLSINYDAIFYCDLDEDQILSYRASSRSRTVFEEESHRFSRFWSCYAKTWVHREDRKMFLEFVDTAYIRRELSEKKTYYFNYRIIDSGQVQYLQLRVVNVGTDEQRHVSQVVIGSHRMDEELAQEMRQKELLAKALDDANQSISAKNTFLSNMSHDIRTPLNAILGYTLLAKQQQGQSPRLYNYLEKIEESGQQLLELLNKVLEITQIGSERTDAAEELCDLHGMFQDIYKVLHPKTEDKGLFFTMDYSGISHSQVYCDRKRLEQVVLYLAKNAVAYTEPGGNIYISVEELEQHSRQFADFQLRVEDTGIGIGQEFLEHIFEPFARERNTTQSRIHGVGLGLSIVKNIVDMMGGKIQVESQVGKGSIFTVTLRLRLPEPQSIEEETFPAQQENQPKRSGEPMRILVVEDNEINQEIETEILRASGFLTDIAENGQIAVEMIRSAEPGKYNLILMDIQMPVMDGWQATEAIRAMSDGMRSQIPIVALSANVFESDVRRSIKSGMNAHLPKPLDVGQLLETIQRFQ